MDEAPLVKPEEKYPNVLGTSLSSGYELKPHLAPEIKRNLPSELTENKTTLLNTNIPSFIPKTKLDRDNEKKKKIEKKI